MSEETTITPALTDEEWRQALTLRRDAATLMGVSVAEDGKLHRIAALALYGQPFGFTERDVVILRNIACLGLDEYEREAIDSIVARLAALLPPNGTTPPLRVERGGLSALSRDEEQHLRDSL